MEFKIYKNPYGEEEFYNNDKLIIEPNKINCFVGCNGSGKTTLIKCIKENLKDNFKEIHSDFYSNAFEPILNMVLNKDNHNNIEGYWINFDKGANLSLKEHDYFTNAAKLAFSSTGEGIVNRFGNILTLIGNTVRKISNTKLLIFIDDADAGTSIDMIQDITDVFDIITKECKERNIEYYIILTANSYELCRNCECIDVNTFEHKQFNNYEDYKAFVLESRKIKDKRIGE